ncbi:SRPBCC family protein [Benzoatithermus flavus]|uniref:Carbon monoxide dehydrogenase subunit G n=1 Tax=Benzoatithermus flavus TaxID=3108223 RepID=A0ABU8XNL8_9PROT
MDMTGEYRIPAPRQRVWEALNDPEILKASIPGCEELHKLSDTELEAKVKAKVGPVSATFTGKVTLGDLNPPESYTISGEGKGGAAGFAKGGAEVALTEDGAGTLLRYHAKADVGGKLAQIGSRLIQGTAKKMADDFFGRFSTIVGERYAAGSATAAVAPSPAPAPAAPPIPPAVEAPQPAPLAAAPTAAPIEPAPPVETPRAAAGATAAEPAPAPRPKQVAFAPEKPATERRPAQPVAPPPVEKGLMQQWWVWLLAVIVVVILLYWLLGS